MERLGRYELIARLAAGGMGEIFLARLEGAAGFAKLFAVKRILPQFAGDERFRKMLIDEATIASKMAHANVCQVVELGEANGQLYIAMEYLEGVTLLPLLRACRKAQRPLELGFVAAVLGQICDALHYAHELRDREGNSLGVIHRDVTLANVFVCESGTAKVLDFGIAKVKDAQGTQTGTVKGKYAYMAPEQLRGETLTRRVDVFALGVVAYEMLALRRLFQRQTDYLTFHAVLEQPIPDLRRYRPDAPPAVIAAVMRALERDPANRFATAREFGTALANAIGRPWPNDRVGDLVGELFGDERAAREAAVARALASPMLDGPPLASNTSDEDDDGFPAVETEVGPISSEVQTVIDRLAQRSIPTATVAPLPSPTRSSKWVWIVLALFALAGAGIAIAYVLSQRTPPPEIIVEQLDTRRLQDAVNPHQDKLLACAIKHPTSERKALIAMMIGADGTVESMRFEPAALGEGPLGECFRGVLQAVQFPKGSRTTPFSLGVTLPGHK